MYWTDFFEMAPLGDMPSDRAGFLHAGNLQVSP